MLHELLVLLFRNQPALIADLLRASFGAELPQYAEARVGSAEFTEIKPVQYHADLVVLLTGRSTEYGIIVEVQLSVDERKRYTWPVYVTSLRAQLRCPVSVVVVTPYKDVARWAGERITLGYHNDFAPLVLSPSAVPQIVTDKQASGDPGLSTLSAIMHNHDRDTRTAAAIAVSAFKVLWGLDTDVSRLYSDLLQTSMSEAVREELRSMDLSQYDPKGVFARHFIEFGRNEGRNEGLTEGRAAVLMRLLTVRFGTLSQDVLAHLKHASITELDRICERVLTASTLQQALAVSIPEARDGLKAHGTVDLDSR